MAHIQILKTAAQQNTSAQRTSLSRPVLHISPRITKGRPISNKLVSVARARPTRQAAFRVWNRQITVPTTISNVPLSVEPFSVLQGVEVYQVSSQNKVTFSSLWSQNERCVIFWARSMGCPFCWELSIELHRKVLPVLQQHGVKLFLVSIGTAQRGLEFVEKTGYPAELLLADPDSASYKALRLRQGIANTYLNPQTPVALLRRFVSGNTQTLFKEVLPKWVPWIPPRQGQSLQQGGVIVFKGHQAAWVHFDPSTSSHANLEEVVSVATEGAGKL